MTTPAEGYILLVEVAETTPVAFGPYTSLSAAQFDLAAQLSGAASVIPLYAPGTIV
jgi:hypothetical protein